MKKVHLPANMQRAGRVDFVLKKDEVQPELDTSVDTYERFDPFNQHSHYNIRDTVQREERIQEKPWWWSYFTRSTLQAPTWLLRRH